MPFRRDRIVEPDHEAISREVLERAARSHDFLAHRVLIRAEQAKGLFRLGRLAERGEAAQVAEHDGDLASVAGEEDLAFSR